MELVKVVVHTIFEHDGLTFSVSVTAVQKHKEIIGVYVDREGNQNDLYAKSIYGKQVIETLGAYTKEHGILSKER